MKRKVNRVGQNTLTVSLPSKWTKKCGLKPGDELDVEQEGSSLIIGRNIKSKFSSVKIDVSNQKKMIHRLVAAVYKSGYDEVLIKYNDYSELKIIQDKLHRNLSSYEIIESKPHLLKVKSILNLQQGDFSKVLKRSFFSLKDMAKDFYNFIDNTDELKSIIIRDKFLDKYTDYCRRELNKGLKTEYKSDYSLYYILEEIEIIGDMYKDLSNIILEDKLKLGTDMKKIIKLTNDLLFYFCDAFFNFEVDKVRIFGDMKDKLLKEIDLIKNVKKNELQVFVFINMLVRSIFEMKSSLIAIHI